MAQFLQPKSINGGINTDYDYELVPSGDYLDAKNVTTFGGVSNIIGNSEIQLKDLDGVTNFTLSSSYVVVGSVKNTLRDSIIYLIANTSGSHLITEFNQLTGIHKVLIKCGTNADSSAINLSTTVQSHNPRIINRADNSEEGDILFWLDKDGVPRKINIRKVKNGAYGANILNEFTTVIKKPPMLSPSDVDLVKVSNGSLTIQNKMYQFAYRYIYDDYEKSVFSPISNTLIPYYIFNETDVIPIDNSIGYNAVSFTVQGGSSNVKDIEIIYREYFDGIWSNFYTIDTIPYQSGSISYVFTGTGQKIPLDNSEAPDVLQYDYVPLSAKAQEVVNGNVVVYGNFVEGYDKSTLTATAGLTTSTYVGDNKMFFDSSLNPASNMILSPGGKYKVGVIYLDEHGRNAGVFTTANQTNLVVNVPHIHWDPTLLAAATGDNWYNTRQTYLPNIQISSTAPSWAKYFRLAITEDNNYESEVVTDVIDYKYASLTLSGDTCSLTNITFPSVANGGPQGDIPFFKAYGVNQYLKVTYSNCDTNLASTVYYDNGPVANSLTYRNKPVGDPGRMIYEYKKLVSTVGGDVTVVVNSAGSPGGYTNTLPNSDFRVNNFTAVGGSYQVEFQYIGSTPVTNIKIRFWFDGTLSGFPQRYPVGSTTYLDYTYTGTLNTGNTFTTTVSVPSGYIVNNVNIQDVNQYTSPVDANITITNNISDEIFYVVNSGPATLLAGLASTTINVPYGYGLTSFKYQTVTGSVTDSYVNVSIVNGSVLPATDSTSPKQLLARISNLGYTFQSGDEISFIYDYYKNKQITGSYFGQGINEKVFKIIDLLIDPKFYQSDGTTIQLSGVWIQLEESAKSLLETSGDTSGATQIVGLKARILRQRKISSTGSQGDIYYEIPQTYEVSSYMPSTQIEMVLAGDCMFKSDYVILDGSTATPIGGKTDSVQRVFYSSIPTKNYLISEDELSPIFLSKINKNGRPAVEDKQARRREFPATVRWSQNLEFNSNVNGLNRFLYLDFKDLDGSFGPIKRLAVRDRMMRCYQEDKVGVLPVYQSIITNASGGTDLTLSTELFNNVQYYAGNYSIGNAVGSLVSDSYADYFIDDIRKAVCRLGLEGITPISITTNINTWSTKNILDDARYVAGYDSENRVVIFSSEKGANKYTIAFSERTERFDSFYTYYPYTINSLNNKLYTSFNSGSLWEHKDSVDYCNFYGVQNDAKMRFVLNENPLIKKVFMTLTEIGNSMWPSEYVKGAANSTDSSIPYTFFRNQEGFYNAPFLRDGGVLTPTVGYPIRGNWCVLEIKSLDPSNYVTLLMLKYGYNESKIN